MPHKDPETRRRYMHEYKRRWKAKHRVDLALSDRAVKANARAKRLGVTGRITIDDVRAVLADGRCSYCGDGGRLVGEDRRSPKLGLLTIDHRIPLADGGANHRSNLVAACFSCNAKKAVSSGPGSWSTNHDCCIDCGTTTRRHSCHGRCGRCHQRAEKARAS